MRGIPLVFLRDVASNQPNAYRRPLSCQGAVRDAQCAPTADGDQHDNGSRYRDRSPRSYCYERICQRGVDVSHEGGQTVDAKHARQLRNRQTVTWLFPSGTQGKPVRKYPRRYSVATHAIGAMKSPAAPTRAISRLVTRLATAG